MKTVPKTLSDLLQKNNKCDYFDLITIDVFDTVLTRTIGEPSSVFFFIGKNAHDTGLTKQTPEHFARARSTSEQQARRVVKSGQDVTLEQIYAKLVETYPELQPHISALIAIELEIEDSLIRMVPNAVATINHLRKKCKYLAFVSDMYLPADFIYQQLQKHNLIEQADKLYVSSQSQRKKGNNGDLLQYVIDQHNAVNKRSIHIGNDWMVDFIAAQHIGMNAIYFSDANLNRYEKIFEKHRWNTSGLSSFFSGISRLTRNQQAKSDLEQKTLVEISSSIISPLLLSYVLWVLKRAQYLNLQRLYFLSREAEILYLIAQIIVAEHDISIELRYLYVSRKAINIALLENATTATMNIALTNHEQDTPRSLLERVGLKPEEIVHELLIIGITKELWDAHLPEDKHKALWEFLNTPEMLENISTTAKDHSALINKYLEENCFFDDISIGLVDTTGIGSQFLILNQLRMREKREQVQGFLMIRIWNPKHHYTEFPSIHSYYQDQYTNKTRYAIPGLSIMLEIFCAAEHGTVIGYQQRENSLEPILQEKTGHKLRKKYTRTIRETIITFTKAFSQQSIIILEVTDLREAVIETFIEFWNNPSKNEAVALGGYPVETTIKNNSDELSVLAPTLKLVDLWRIHRYDSAATFLGIHVWRAGAEMRSDSHITVLIKIASLLKNKYRSLSNKLPTKLFVFFQRGKI